VTADDPGMDRRAPPRDVTDRDVVTRHPVIEDALDEWATSLGPARAAYRGHGVVVVDSPSAAPTADGSSLRPVGARSDDQVIIERAAHVNRLTNSSAFSATSRQPASIVSVCPRPVILTISVTSWLRFCFS